MATRCHARNKLIYLTSPRAMIKLRSHCFIQDQLRNQLPPLTQAVVTFRVECSIVYFCLRLLAQLGQLLSRPFRVLNDPRRFERQHELSDFFIYLVLRLINR
jgi:hypothetical protein